MNQKGRMKMHFSADMTVESILEGSPDALALFKANGLGKFEDDETRRTLGSILKLRTALSMARADEKGFLSALNGSGSEAAGLDFALDYSSQSRLSMLGLLPCGMKMSFKRSFEAFLLSREGRAASGVEWKCLVEGNVNHEYSYYPYIDTIRSADEIPDVVVCADINSFMHHRFMRELLPAGGFKSLNDPANLNPDFAGTGYLDPKGRYTMLSANLLVLVVNKSKAAGLKIPGNWADLLGGAYADKLVIRGQEGSFCNGVLMPFHQLYGMDGVRSLARAVRGGMHPAEMVEDIERGRADAAPLYIMPLFFAKRLKDASQFEIVIPEDGAIVSPVFMLVRSSRAAEASAIADFILGREMSQTCADAGFPSVRADVGNKLPAGAKLLWMGWDYLEGSDPAVVKAEIERAVDESRRR